VAAEVSRRLTSGEGREAPLLLDARMTEVWVDLAESAAEGFEPPIPFLARADHLRRPPAAPAVAAPSPEGAGHR
jgi:hypothetical protein